MQNAHTVTQTIGSKHSQNWCQPGQINKCCTIYTRLL